MMRTRVKGTKLPVHTSHKIGERYRVGGMVRMWFAVYLTLRTY